MTDRESSTMALGIDGPSAKAQYVLVRTTLPPSFCFKRSQKAMSMTNISGSSKTTSTKNDDSGQSSRSNIIVESSGLTAAATAASSSPAPSSHGVTTTTKFTVKAPGRICLFGEHQDYLGFPVISMAIPLHCIIDVTVDVKKSSTEDSGNNNAEAEREPVSKKPRIDDSSHRCRGRRIIQLDIPQLQQSKIYDLDNLPPKQTSESLTDGNGGPDFALSSIYEVLDEGWSLLMDNNDDSSSFHVTCRSTSEIIMQAGCSSSTAFITAWILMLSKLATTGSSSSSKKLDVELELNPIYLGKLAHRAEVSHFNAPGGTMDHVTIALGSKGGRQDNGSEESGSVAGPFLRIGPGQWDVQRLPPPSTIATATDDDSDCNNDNEIDYYFVLAYSGEPKDTMKHLQRCKGDRLDILKEKLNGNWDNATDVLKGDDDSSLTISSDERVLIETTLINRRTEIQAAELLTSTTTAALIDKIGSLMNEHHVALRDGLKLSTKRLEDMRNAALNAGAVGYKLVGSGGGGCSISLTSSQDQAKKIATAIRNVNDTIQTWIITTKQPCRGAHIEEVAK